MQKSKKILAVMLSLVMLFCVLPVNASATNETYPEITLDEVIDLSFNENDRYYIYAFTPTETGIYSFSSFDNGDEEEHLDTYGTIYDSEMERIADNDDYYELNNFNVIALLNANKTYYLEATTYYYHEHSDFKNGSCSIIITKSDANITPLTLNTPLTETVDGNDISFFSFTPSETAVYEISSTYNYEELSFIFDKTFDSNNNSIDFIYYNNENVSDNSEKSIIQYKFQKDITYYFQVSIDGSGSYTFNIRRPAEATSILLEETSINGFVGLGYNNTANFGPEGCAYENTTWSITDESIAEIINYGDNLGGRALYIKMLKAGTAVITATSESGLTTTFPITAKEPKEAFVDNAITDTLSYEENEHAYKFIPENDGIYNFQLSGSSNFELLVYNRHGNCMTEQSGMIINAQPTLTKGETYYIKISSTYHEPEEDFKADYTFNITVPSAATSLEIICDTESIYPSNNIYLHPVFTPDNSIIESIDWTIEDTEIASLNGQYPDGSIAIYCKKPGTTTVTATSRNGLTATYTLTVKSYDVLTLDTPYTQTTNSYETTYVQFTPSETAVYEICFERPNHVPFSYDLMDTDYNSLNYIYSYSNSADDIIEIEKAQYRLEKDKTYYIRVSAEGAMTYTVSLTKSEKATSMVLSQTSIDGLSGKSYGMQASFGPNGCAYENVIWTIDDDSVAEISYNPDNCGGIFLNIKLLKAGTATITATSESGLTATCTVNVTEPEEIFVDTTAQGTLTEQNPIVIYKFIPQKDGAYKFSHNDSENTSYYLNFHLRNNNGELILYSDGNFIEEQCILEQGKTYYLEISAPATSDGFNVDYFINITMPPKATSMEIECNTETPYPKDLIDLCAVFNPDGSAIENVEWSVEDPEIANINSYSDSGIELYCQNSGTTTITATTESGLSASYILTVKSYSDAPELKLNENNVVSTDANTSIFKFTPEESGTYAFYSTGNVTTECIIYNSEMETLIFDQMQQHNFYLTYMLDEGETYYIKAYLDSNYDNAATYNIRVEKAVPATSIRILNGSSYEGYIGSSISLFAKIYPDNAIKENLIWTVEDESIAYFCDMMGDTGRVLYLNNVGTTTVTVSTESGLSDSIEITVKDTSKPESIKISEGSYIEKY